MNPHLMRPARFEPAFDQRVGAKSFEDADVRDGPLTG
jgi:hypothetical protein